MNAVPVKPHLELARRYFDDLARRFPVMCASDEFDFLPRAQAAAGYYDRLDEMDAETLEECIGGLKALQQDFSRLAAAATHLEDGIDLELLQASIAGVLIALEQKRTWQHNPLLYLKIAFIGLDHALNKPASDREERVDRVLARLAAVPRIFRQAQKNIGAVPESYHRAAGAMVLDGRQYLESLGRALPGTWPPKPAAALAAGLEKALAALESLEKFCASVDVGPDGLFALGTLEKTLGDHFLCRRSVEEIYQLALKDWHRNLDRLRRLQAAIDPGTGWQQLYHGYLPAGVENTDTFSLYAGEIRSLETFFRHQGLMEVNVDAPLEIAETPRYLRSVRGAASFAAAFTARPEETSYFYITTRPGGGHDAMTEALLKKRFHREYKLLTAHETFPGHHLLDAVRRRLPNPVRRQVESPLFYEGWASYAESMLVDSGYIDNPMDLLVDCKRKLWRAARCQVDVGLATGKIDTAAAMNLLQECGFSPREARRQVDRFRLNPGYQLCYSLGAHEFKRLRERFCGPMECNRFHRLILEGGELPFHLIEKRLNHLRQAMLE